MTLMTTSSFKVNNLQYKKPFLNSSFVNTKTLSKSRSLLKNSILKYSLKTNNIELAKSLSAKEAELFEVRKENNRLLKNNYDIVNSNQFRSYNCDSFLKKFYSLSSSTLTIFNEVCKLSDSILELQNHPFLTGEEVHANNDEPKTPDPFVSRDKIQRSPTQPFDSHNTTQPSLIAGFLADKLSKLKDQSMHSIHNISMNYDSNFSIRKAVARPSQDISHTGNTKFPSTLNAVQDPQNTSFVFDSNFKVTKRKKTNLNIQTTDKIKARSKPKKHNDDPMFSFEKPKKNSRKLKNLKLKIDSKPPNKEEYKKKKELDAFYLSQNETINVTLVPPTLNEFKGLLERKSKENIESNFAEEQNKIILETINVQPEALDSKKTTVFPTNDKIDINNDDDDFIFPKKKTAKNCRIEEVNIDKLDNIQVNISPIKLNNGNTIKFSNVELVIATKPILTKKKTAKPKAEIIKKTVISPIDLENCADNKESNNNITEKTSSNAKLVISTEPAVTKKKTVKSKAEKIKKSLKSLVSEENCVDKIESIDSITKKPMKQKAPRTKMKVFKENTDLNTLETNSNAKENRDKIESEAINLNENANIDKENVDCQKLESDMISSPTRKTKRHRPAVDYRLSPINKKKRRDD